MTCKHCRTRLEADRVLIYGMFDCHLFHRYEGATVDDVIDNWLTHISDAIPGEYADGQKVADIGPTDLCPAIVLAGEVELRRVGPFVHVRRDRTPNPADVEKYRNALNEDTDIPRLLASTATPI